MTKLRKRPARGRKRTGKGRPAGALADVPTSRRRNVRHTNTGPVSGTDGGPQGTLSAPYPAPKPVPEVGVSSNAKDEATARALSSSLNCTCLEVAKRVEEALSQPQPLLELGRLITSASLSSDFGAADEGLEGLCQVFAEAVLRQLRAGQKDLVEVLQVTIDGMLAVRFALTQDTRDPGGCSPRDGSATSWRALRKLSQAMQLAASIASGSGLGGLMLCHVAQALLQLLREMSKARTLSALDCMSRTIDVANVMFGLQEGLVRGLGTDMLQPGPKLTAQGGGDLVAAVTALILAVWDECGERIGMATPYPLASATQQARRSLVILVSQLETIAASQGTASISAVGQHLLHNACGRFS